MNSIYFYLMNKLVIYFWTLMVLLGLYVTFNLVSFFRLKLKLKNADLTVFKKELGKNYQYKAHINGWTKYKWLVGMMLVRARFNESGQLMECEIKPYRFFPLMYKKSFL